MAGRSGFSAGGPAVPDSRGWWLLTWFEVEQRKQDTRSSFRVRVEQGIGALLGPERTTICEGGGVSLGSHDRYRVFLVGGGGLRVCCQVQSGREHLFS